MGHPPTKSGNVPTCSTCIDAHEETIALMPTKKQQQHSPSHLHEEVLYHSLRPHLRLNLSPYFPLATQSVHSSNQHPQPCSSSPLLTITTTTEVYPDLYPYLYPYPSHPCTTTRILAGTGTGSRGYACIVQGKNTVNDAAFCIRVSHKVGEAGGLEFGI